MHTNNKKPVGGTLSAMNPAIGVASLHNSMPVPSLDKWEGQLENLA